MFSIFKKKKIVCHLRLAGVIGNVGKFRQGIEYSSQEDIIKKAFSIKKALAVIPKKVAKTKVIQWAIVKAVTNLNMSK